MDKTVPKEDKIITDEQGNIWKYIAKTGEIVLISGSAIATVVMIAPLIQIVGFSTAASIGMQWGIAGVTGYGAGTIISNIIDKVKLWKRLFSFNKATRLKKLRDSLLEEAAVNNKCRESCFQMARSIDEIYQDLKRIKEGKEALKASIRAARSAKKAKPRFWKKTNVESDNVGPEAAAAGA